MKILLTLLMSANNHIDIILLVGMVIGICGLFYALSRHSNKEKKLEEGVSLSSNTTSLIEELYTDSITLDRIKELINMENPRLLMHATTILDITLYKKIKELRKVFESGEYHPEQLRQEIIAINEESYYEVSITSIESITLLH